MLIIFVSVFPRTWVRNTYAFPRSYMFSSARADANNLFRGGEALCSWPDSNAWKYHPWILHGSFFQVTLEKYIWCFLYHHGPNAKYLLVKMDHGAHASRKVKFGMCCSQMRANPNQWSWNFPMNHCQDCSETQEMGERLWCHFNLIS